MIVFCNKKKNYTHISDDDCFYSKKIIPEKYMVIVAQLVRASVCGSEGHEFESRLSPSKKSSTTYN